jgi:hypothetical protein
MKGGYAAAVSSGSTTNVFITESSLDGSTYDAYFTGTNKQSVISNSFLGGAGTGVYLSGTAQNVCVTNCGFNGTNGIEFAAGITGTKFEIVGNPTLGSTTAPIVMSAATLPVYRQWGNGIESFATSGATGGAQTPVLYRGNEVTLSATSGGAGTVTVNAPAVLPGTSASDVNLYWDFVFKNAAAGAVTWSLNAVFVVASAIPTTDAHTISVRFRWDKATSKLREVSRADTVT